MVWMTPSQQQYPLLYKTCMSTGLRTLDKMIELSTVCYAEQSHYSFHVCSTHQHLSTHDKDTHRECCPGTQYLLSFLNRSR